MSVRRLVAVALLVLVTSPALGRSGDPELRCPAETRRVDYSDLAFCWPLARTAAGFGFRSLDLLQGHQWWIEGHRVAEDDLKEIPDERRRMAILATFVVIPVEHPLIKSHWATLDRSRRIEAAIEASKADTARFSVTLYQGEKFGEQSFDFHRVGPTLFSAEKRLAPDEGPAQQISYWVSMNDAGHVDYVMSCLRVETVQGCSSRFLLSRNLVSVTISLSKDATSARAAFEDLRGQIRSYLISPDLDTK
jgi:hypothetical protein